MEPFVPPPEPTSETNTQNVLSSTVGSSETASEHLKETIHPEPQDTAMADIGNSMSSLSIEQKNTPEMEPERSASPPKPVLHPVEIQWIQGGTKVYVTGLFTGWTKMIKMKPIDEKLFSIRLNLPVGTHRFRFVVDNELRFLDYLPTATDLRGNFVNYIEILQPSPSPPPSRLESERMMLELTPEQRAKLQLRIPKTNAQDLRLGLTQDDDDMGGGYSRFHEKSMLNNAKAIAGKADRSYTSSIPAIFVDPQAMERYYLTVDQQSRGSGSQWLTPPLLPPHLDHVILNNQQNHSDAGSFNKDTNSGGSLPIPNHVVLNHLATTSIRHNTLAVATTVRYKRKYLTQILYCPL